MNEPTYRVIASVFAAASHALRAPRTRELTGAVADMGTGMVIDETGRVVAFHESHLRSLSAGAGNWRV